MEATCGDDGAWRVLRWSCNPPALEPCPAEAPDEGTACQLTDPTECHYACAPSFECVAGAWRAQYRTSCNPPPLDDDGGVPDDDGGV